MSFDVFVHFVKYRLFRIIMIATECITKRPQFRFYFNVFVINFFFSP